MPNLYVIGGCNGAGKTTASYTILPDMLKCTEFLNADEIAKGLSPFEPERVSFESGRIMLARIDKMMREQKDFAIESTLTTRYYVRIIEKAKAAGYTITLLYIWLNSPELAVERVKTRVLEGGHNIPHDVIYRRYRRGMRNLFKLFIPLADYWMMIDNSNPPYKLIAEGHGLENVKVHASDIYDLIKSKSNE